MLKKPLAIAAIAVAATTSLLPSEASAGDPALGALFGAAFGAAIGHGVSGHDGAVVGGVLGAITGASIAASSHPYPSPAYDGPPSYRPAAPAYYAPAYRPAVPVVRYAPPVVVAPRYVVVHRPLRPVYAPVVVARPRHGHPGPHGHGGPWR